MEKSTKLKKIVISGPESTGKTELAFTLAQRLGTVYVPEYAREYIENLSGKYTYEDVENIARYQIAQEKIYEKKVREMLIFDTWLIITKVWFEVVFGKCPDWVIKYIEISDIDLFLVCSTDLPWIPDPVRENGGIRREELFKTYCREIEFFGFRYEVIQGIGEKRIANALKAIQSHGLVK